MLFKFASCSDLTSPPNTEAQKRVLICACLCGARTGGRRRVRVLAVESLRLPSRRRRCTSSLAAAPSGMRKRGESPQGRYPRIEPVSFLGNPVSRRGTRALAFSEAPRISCRAKVDKQKPVLISRGLHPIQAVNMERREEQSDEC